MEELTPDTIFKALGKEQGGDASPSVYHRITGPLIQVPAELIPTKISLDVKDGVLITTVEGSEACLDLFMEVAEEFGFEVLEDE